MAASWSIVAKLVEDEDTAISKLSHNVSDATDKTPGKLKHKGAKLFPQSHNVPGSDDISEQMKNQTITNSTMKTNWELMGGISTMAQPKQKSRSQYTSMTVFTNIVLVMAAVAYSIMVPITMTSTQQAYAQIPLYIPTIQDAVDAWKHVHQTYDMLWDNKEFAAAMQLILPNLPIDTEGAPALGHTARVQNRDNQMVALNLPQEVNFSTLDFIITPFMIALSACIALAIITYVLHVQEQHNQRESSKQQVGKRRLSMKNKQ